MHKRIEPILGDWEAALELDSRVEPLQGDINDCVCFDEQGNPINECNECPR